MYENPYLVLPRVLMSIFRGCITEIDHFGCSLDNLLASRQLNRQPLRIYNTAWNVGNWRHLSVCS
jgi:hypothetical protein